MDRLVLSSWGCLYILCWGLPLTISDSMARRIFGKLIPISAILLLVSQYRQPSLWKLTASSLFLLYPLKASILLSFSRPTVRKFLPFGLPVFMTIWPGMAPKAFAVRESPLTGAGKTFIRGLLFLYVGVAFFCAVVALVPLISDLLIGWLGIAAILLTIHFGLSDILTGLAMYFGWRIGPLFCEPYKSQTISDFWTVRWNRPFVEMDRRLFMKPLTKYFGLRGAVFGVFLVSGLLHEMAISFPSGGGFGGPMLYFALQGALVLGEKHFKFRSRPLTWVAILAPLPLLFHHQFQHTFIVPLFTTLNHRIATTSVTWFVDHALWFLGAMQISVLMASFQVPTRLNWRTELPRLSSLNQKLMWTNGAFIVFTIVAFGTLTLTLHRSFMLREPAAIGIAAFALTFWVLRIVVDCLFYRSSDWPKGEQFVIGHSLLNSLFALLVLGYGGYVFWAIAS